MTRAQAIGHRFVTATSAGLRTRDERGKLEEHDLFYLYEVEQRLGVG